MPIFDYFCNCIPQRVHDILLDSHTITTVEIRANLHIGTVPCTGADFPYLKVVCGEPCDVWRMSAPLALNSLYIVNHLSSIVMKIINYFTFSVFAFICIFMFSCSNEEETIPQIIIPSGSTDFFHEGLVFPSVGGEFEIVFSTNVSWSMSFDRFQGWCTLSQEKGEAGTQHVKIKAVDNTTYDDRVAEITILAGDSARHFMVFQNSKEALVLSQKVFDVNTEEQDIIISVKTNVDYSVTIKDASWIKEEVVQTRGLTENVIKLHVSENEGYEDRIGEVIVSSKDGVHSELVTVTQRAKDIIILDDNVFTFDESGGEFTVGVTSNVDYYVQIWCDWITEIKENTTRSLLTSHRTFKVKELTDEANRSAIISFYYPSELRCVDVNVFQHSTFSFDVNSISLIEGGTRQIVLNNEKGLVVAWNSSNTSVATVDNAGHVTAVSAGTAIITATANDGKHCCKCTVDVKSISDYITCNAGVSLEGGNVWKTKFIMYNSCSEQVRIDRIEVQQNGYFVRSFENEGYLWSNSSREFTMDILTGWITFIANYSYGGKSYKSSYRVLIIDTGYGYSVGY